MVFEIVWEYEVRPEKVAAFEVLYGPEGDWAYLFSRADGYVETRLLRDTASRCSTSPSTVGSLVSPTRRLPGRPGPLTLRSIAGVTS